MTSNTVSAKLDAVLDPLAAIQAHLQAALDLAQRTKLPSPFIYIIKDSATALDGIHHTLMDIAVALDPDLAKDQL